MLSGLLIGSFDSFAQSNPCPSCVQISPGDVELYKELFPLTIWTDSKIYDHDSLITVSGHLRPENNVAPILVVVTNPIGNIVTVDQVTPDSNGDFEFMLNTKSSLWKQNGDYVIKAQSGSDNRQFKTKFTLISYDVGSVSECALSTIPIIANNGGIYCVSYESKKGTTINVDGELNLDTKTLSLQIRGHDIDSIVLDIPRYLLDSKSETGVDSDFVIFSEGTLIETHEVESDDVSRKIQIDYSPTRKGNFEIVGTHVVPEFGSLMFLILISSVSSVLFISKLLSDRFVKF
ncbi:PEFG-CTERM sorting domain-containing protein [Nitrosopumilus sp. K4]|nr:PEFG-CTERM sorting domain-containing protein [Nitrosopumilus sp. K4]